MKLDLEQLADGIYLLDDLLNRVIFFGRCSKTTESTSMEREEDGLDLVSKTFEKHIVYEVVCLFYDKHVHITFS
jgi:hypothetical protein